MQFSYNSKKIEFYDESQARDSSGKWTDSGGSSAQVTDKSVATDNGRKTTTVYHGTSADVLKKIRENGLQPSKGGVYGAGVYATDNIEVALEYGAMKAPDSRYNNPFAPKVSGKTYIGLVEVISSGFKEVSRYTDPTRKSKGDKKGDSIGILLNKGKVPPSAIKSMKLFDLKDVRSWIFEGGVKPKPVAEKKLEEGVYYVPIVIHESELTNLEEGKCPVETQDIKANLENRQEAIDIAHYGPANPKEPNEDYWKAKAKIFNGSVEEAKTMRCGNCAGFNQTKKLIDCITKGIGMDAKEVEQAGDLGFCEIFDFKCASLRTCDAWIVGGPITDKANLEQLKSDLLSLKEQGATLLYDPSQQRDESGKWSGSGASAQGKFIERIKRDNPNANVASEAVKKGVDTIIKGVRGAKIAGQYGATKTAEIKKWLGSSEGKEFLNTAGDTLRVIGAGAIGAIRGINNDRYKILVGGLVNPALVPYLAGASATRGMFEQVAKEYRGKRVGRTISNKIREKIGVKPMQAFVETIKLQVKQPPIDDVVSYLADVLRVSIEEAIEGKERFEVVSFYDPSQDRDSSGKWTDAGASQAKEVDPERRRAIESELRTTGYDVDVVPKKEEMRELNEWSASLAENDYTPEDAERMSVGLKAYASANPMQKGGFRSVNKFLRGKQIPQRETDAVFETLNALKIAFQGGPKNKEDVVYRGSKSDAGVGNINKSYTHNIAKYIKVGVVLTNKGFFSATKSDSIADEFSNNMHKKSKTNITQSQVFLKLSSAKNKGIVMPMFAGIGREKEVLFPEKTKIKVTKVKRIEHETPAHWANRGVPKTYSTFIEGKIL